MNHKTKRLTALLLILGMALPGCATQKEKATTVEGLGKPHAKQVLRLVETSELSSMDSSLVVDSTTLSVLNNVMEGLYRQGKDSQPVPGIAKSYTVSKDKKTYVFKLRDAKWSNGDPVTAHDFEYSWKRTLDPAIASEYAYIMYDVKNAKEINEKQLPADQLGVKAIDDHTLEVQLDNPVPYFLSLTTLAPFMPQNEKVIIKEGKNYGLEANSVVYDGPFKMSEWKHEQSFKLEKNQEYWDKKTVKLDEINFKIAKDNSTAINLYETGAIDRVSLTAEFVDKYKDDKDFKTAQEGRLIYLKLNNQNPFLKNVNARKAIDMGYNKKGITDVLLNNGSTPAYYFVARNLAFGPDGKDFYDTTGDFNKTNIAKAKEYWGKAKQELGKQSVDLELLIAEDDNNKKISQYLKYELEKNLPGLTVNIKMSPAQPKFALEDNLQYDMSLAGWGPDYPDPMTFLDKWVTNNNIAYSNPKYDELITKAKTTLLQDPPARWKTLAEAEELLLEKDAAISPIYQNGVAYLEKSYVNNVYNHPYGVKNSYKWASIKK
ncbi:peptide ABC transporter substrate-binding protein [Bacillus sp. AFS055030]|uniref:peptide ABC transporter substrate-binding protein n=1 Tax=Bacillus sp. AFS055030 TaxID=2033507 RepID=UPI0025708F06|nr:peptide ABC transporter substrate-binding protein [Bacillus sp. AFS055030]